MRVLRYVDVAAHNGKIGLAFREQIGAGGGAVGLDRAQPHRTLMLREGLGQCLHDLDVVAVGGADRDL
ncbi:hypothetical protein ACVIQY_003760 [Bradyrhizobium sp. USDA 3051]